MSIRPSAPRGLALEGLVPSLLAALAVAIGLAASPAASADGRIAGRDRFIARAEVLDARPVYADVAVREPRLECAVDRRPPRARVEVYGARPGDRDRDRYRSDAYRADPRDDPRREHGRREVDARGAVIVGSLVGGAVGNRLTRDGSRGARAAGTVAGALVGAGAARELAHGYDRRHGPRRPHRGPAYGHGPGRDYGRDYGRGHDRGRERCVRVVETRTERRLVHYDVTYLFRGRTFRARRDRDPGATIEIDVSVSPSYR